MLFGGETCVCTEIGHIDECYSKTSHFWRKILAIWCIWTHALPMGELKWEKYFGPLCSCGVALSSCAQFAKWFRGLVSGLGVLLAYCEPVVILTDSQSAMNLAQSGDHRSNKYSRHIQQRVCWLRELIQDGSIRLAFTEGNDNTADIFTKVLGDKKFKRFRKKLLHGDRRVFRDTLNLICVMQYLSATANPLLSIPEHACNCHKRNFHCISTHEPPTLLHRSHDLDWLTGTGQSFGMFF